MYALPAEACPVDGPRREALDDDVPPCKQPAEHLGAPFGAEVDRDVALVSVPLDLRVDALVDRAGAVGDPGVGHEGTRQRAAGERLHLDDIGTHVAEEAGAEGPGPDFGEVDHADAGERRARHRPTPCAAWSRMLIP